MDLDQIRQEIDDIDEKLVSLLEERMALVKKVAQLKKVEGLPIFDQAREQSLLESIAYKVSNKEYEATLLAIFSDLMSQSRLYQEAYLDNQQ